MNLIIYMNFHLSITVSLQFSILCIIFNFHIRKCFIFAEFIFYHCGLRVLSIYQPHKFSLYGAKGRVFEGFQE
jgi:hypothetical protein